VATPPISDITTPTVAAGFVWAANASTPIYDVTAPTVQAGSTWSATSTAPIIDVVVTPVAASFTWSATADTPVTGGAGDVAAPTISASRAWSASSIDPLIGEHFETIGSYDKGGNYGPIGLGPIARKVRAQRAWVANALPPEIAPAVLPDVIVRAVSATITWTCVARIPNQLWRTTHPIVIPHYQLSRSRPAELQRSRNHNMTLTRSK
jgi:hypothetical protein